MMTAVGYAPIRRAGTSFTRWAAIVPCLCIPRAATADAWPQWRGPDGQGHAATARDLPIEWSEMRHVVWKRPLPGRGWSSPVLDETHVWMTAAVEHVADDAEKAARLAGNKNTQPVDVAASVTMHALAVDRETGRLVHDVALFAVEKPQPVHALNSYASPTPVLAAGRLYCHFGDYGTACVDTASARVAWVSRDLRLDHMNGPGSTPVLWRDRLVIPCDGSDVQFIAALDAATGRVLWKTPRSGALQDNPDLKKAYGTPLVVSAGGRDVLVSPAADWVYGYDPESGRELWRLSYGVLGFSVVPRPVWAHGLVFMSTSFTKPEVLAVRPGEAGRGPEIAWRQPRGAPSMPSPLVVGDELYVVSDKGIATCLDARTGGVVWSERLGGNFSSSPLFADGRIYVGNRAGETFVFKPGRTFELLATNRLDGQIFATPAALGRALYLRTDGALYRIEAR
ncbi:MAG: serine/threonine protein kinase [Planctomycetia bacterium]|nr:serine/threonine protein kinase [Planctomycetia bacterium]